MLPRPLSARLASLATVLRRALLCGFSTGKAHVYGLPVVVLGLLLCAAQPAAARDPVAGKARAGMCATCHGPLGMSQLPNAPHLAGQPAIYTVEQLKNYRSGKRQNEVMAVLAKSLSDQDIENLAAWYESIQISVTEK